MASKRQETLEETFKAKDASGREYTINRYQEWIIDHEGDRLRSLGRYALTTGGAVNRTDDESFHIVSLDIDVKRV